MARTTCLLIALAIVCSLAVSDAQCIECKDCKGSNTCLSVCKKSCAPPTTSGVNIETCKKYGENIGKDSAKFACDLTMQYCRSGAQPRMGSGQKVSLQQCGNAAYGVCQSFANDSRKSPCGSSFNGVGKCSKSEFTKFYSGVVDEQCNQKSAPFDKPQGGR